MARDKERYGGDNLTEWSVFEVILALFGAFLTIGTPVLKLNTTIIKLQAMLENMQKNFDSVTAKNTESHRRLWEHIDGQDRKIEEHSGRIEKLEGRMNAYHDKQA